MKIFNIALSRSNAVVRGVTDGTTYTLAIHRQMELADEPELEPVILGNYKGELLDIIRWRGCNNISLVVKDQNGRIDVIGREITTTNPRLMTDVKTSIIRFVTVDVEMQKSYDGVGSLEYIGGFNRSITAGGIVENVYCFKGSGGAICTYVEVLVAPTPQELKGRAYALHSNQELKSTLRTSFAEPLQPYLVASSTSGAMLYQPGYFDVEKRKVSPTPDSENMVPVFVSAPLEDDNEGGSVDDSIVYPYETTPPILGPVANMDASLVTWVTAEDQSFNINCIEKKGGKNTIRNMTLSKETTRVDMVTTYGDVAYCYSIRTDKETGETHSTHAFTNSNGHTELVPVHSADTRFVASNISCISMMQEETEWTFLYLSGVYKEVDTGMTLESMALMSCNPFRVEFSHDALFKEHADVPAEQA